MSAEREDGVLKMKNKQLSINLISNFIAFAVNAGLTFALTPYVVGKVGSEAYGFVPLAYNMINYTSILTSALNSMASRFISIEINSNNNEQANIYFNSVFKANIIIASLLMIPSIFIVTYIDKIFNVPHAIINDVKLSFGFVFINIIISLIGNVFNVATFSTNRLELNSYRNIEGNIIKLVITILLFWFFEPKIYYLILSSLAVTVYMLFANIHYTNKLLPQVILSWKIYSSSAIKKLLQSGLWNTVNQLSWVLLNNLDLLISNIFIGSALAGKYSLSKTVPNFIVSFISSLVTVFVPQFTILYAQKKKRELLDSINLSIKITSLIIAIPLSFLIIFGDTFFALWLPDEETAFLYLLSNLTIIPLAITGSIEPIHSVFTVTNKLKLSSIVLLITGILNTAIIAILLKVTSFGVVLIPLVSLFFSLIRNLIFTPVYAARCLNIKWWTLYVSIFKGLLCNIVMLVICLIYKSIWNVSTWPIFIIAALICSCIALIINIFILFDKNEIKEIFHYLKFIK